MKSDDTSSRPVRSSTPASGPAAASAMTALISPALVSRAARLFAAYRAPVVLCAGAGDIATLGAAIIEGADECMIAPVDPDLLRFKLEQTGVLSAAV